MDPEKTGDFIRKLRIQNGMTQKELAERLGCTDKAVSRWETGKGFPDVSYLIDLADALDVNVNELLLGSRIEEDDRKANDRLLVETLRSSGKKENRLKLAVLALLCVLLLAVYYAPVAAMTPSDTMGVLFLHVLGTWVVSFAAGFVNSKLRWAFPVYAFIAYCPVVAILDSADLMLYAGFFLACGYVLILLAAGLTAVFARIKRKLKKKE